MIWWGCGQRCLHEAVYSKLVTFEHKGDWICGIKSQNVHVSADPGLQNTPSECLCWTGSLTWVYSGLWSRPIHRFIQQVKKMDGWIMYEFNKLGLPGQDYRLLSALWPYPFLGFYRPRRDIFFFFP